MKHEHMLKWLEVILPYIVVFLKAFFVIVPCMGWSLDQVVWIEIIDCFPVFSSFPVDIVHVICIW